MLAPPRSPPPSQQGNTAQHPHSGLHLHQLALFVTSALLQLAPETSLRPHADVLAHHAGPDGNRCSHIRRPVATGEVLSASRPATPVAPIDVLLVLMMERMHISSYWQQVRRWTLQPHASKFSGLPCCCAQATMCFSFHEVSDSAEPMVAEAAGDKKKGRAAWGNGRKARYPTGRHQQLLNPAKEPRCITGPQTVFTGLHTSTCLHRQIGVDHNSGLGLQSPDLGRNADRPQELGLTHCHQQESEVAN